MKLSTLIEIAELKPEDFDGMTSYNIELVSVYDDCDPSEVEDLSIKELRLRVEQINEELSKMDRRDCINIKGTDLHVKPFPQLTLGEYIDLDSFLVANKMSHVIAVLYRERSGGGMKRYVYESYSDIDIDDRAKMMMDVEADNILPVLTEYREFRQNTIDTYSSLFSSNEVIDEPDADLTESEIKMRDAEKLHSQFSWESFILFLANDDVTKWDKVCDLPVYLAFNMASFMKSKSPNK